MAKQDHWNSHTQPQLPYGTYMLKNRNGFLLATPSNNQNQITYNDDERQQIVKKTENKTWRRVLIACEHEMACKRLDGANAKQVKRKIVTRISMRRQYSLFYLSGPEKFGNKNHWKKWIAMKNTLNIIQITFRFSFGTICQRNGIQSDRKKVYSFIRFVEWYKW